VLTNLFIYLISNSYSSTQEKKKKKKNEKNGVDICDELKKDNKLILVLLNIKQINH